MKFGIDSRFESSFLLNSHLMEGFSLVLRTHCAAAVGGSAACGGGEGIFQEAGGNHQEVVTMINASHINMMTIRVVDLKWITGGHQWTREDLL